MDYRSDYARTKKAQDSPINRSIYQYNNVPENITNSQNVEIMLINLKKYLKQD